MGWFFRRTREGAYAEWFVLLGAFLGYFTDNHGDIIRTSGADGQVYQRGSRLFDAALPQCGFNSGGCYRIRKPIGAQQDTVAGLGVEGK